MNILRRFFQTFVALSFVSLTAATAVAQETAAADTPYEPTVGQAGKDVVWVPTPYALIEKMLDMAKVTPQDFVMDLGSGDGRNVIAAAKRGARALGVEYEQKMVELSTARAAKEGVADKAQFVQGDMYEADVSQATVLALFLLTQNLDKLAPKFLAMKPGSRIVSNGFEITGWTPEETQRIEGDCGSWCTAHLYLVPAKVEGTWRLGKSELALKQQAQTISGTLTSGGKTVQITNGRVRGEQIVFTAAGSEYTGRVQGDTMQGRVKGTTSGAWSAVRSDL